MWIDSRLEFCDSVSVAETAGTYLKGDVINTQEIGKDLGNPGGLPLYLVIQCTTSIITGGSAGTIQFKLASDASASIDTAGNATEHWVSKAFVTDGDDANDIDAGAIIAKVPLPMESLVTYEQYLGILVVVATETVTAGAIDAFLTIQPPAWKSLADAVN